MKSKSKTGILIVCLRPKHVDRKNEKETAVQPIRVLIVDDTLQVRRDLRQLLQLVERIEVIAEAANGVEAIQQAEIYRPDVILMDVSMPVLDGCAAVRQIKARGLPCKVVMLSIHAGEEQCALEAGSGHLSAKGRKI